MTISTNLINTQRTVTDKTTNYFNNYFLPSFAVAQDLNESVIGYFEQISADKPSAKTLAASVIFTCKMQNLDIMTVLNEFNSLPPGQLNTYLTMFLNLNRVGTSLLGVSNAPVTSKYITRMIKA